MLHRDNIEIYRGAIHTRKSYVTLLCQDSSPKRCVSPWRSRIWHRNRISICLRAAGGDVYQALKDMLKFLPRKQLLKFLLLDTCNSFGKPHHLTKWCQAPKVMATSPVLTVGRPTSPTSPYARALTPLVSTPRRCPCYAQDGLGVPSHALGKTRTVSQKGCVTMQKQGAQMYLEDTRT